MRFVSIVSPLYISEISPKHLRGRLVSLFQLTICIGIVVAMLVNAGIVQLSPNITDSSMAVIQSLFGTESWRGMFMMEAIPAFLFLVLCFSIPRSPRWLVGKGQMHEAQQVLERVRATRENASKELAEIEEAGPTTAR